MKTNSEIISIQDRNAFRVKCILGLGDERTDIIDALIDTGCQLTSISANLIYSESVLETCQMNDIQNWMESGKKFILSGGVESMILKDGKYVVNAMQPKTVAEAYNNKNIKFPHYFESITLNGMQIEGQWIRVSYGIQNLALIGIDTLNQFDIVTKKYKEKRVMLLISKKNKGSITHKLMDIAVNRILSGTAGSGGEQDSLTPSEVVELFNTSTIEANYIQNKLNNTNLGGKQTCQENS